MTLTEQARNLILNGNLLLRQKDHGGAVAVYNDALRAAPACAEAYHNRGVARRGLDDTTGALADAEQALRINPDYAEAHTFRGDLRRKLGDLAGALADHERALGLAPRLASALNNRGATRYDLGDYSGAIADFDAALAVRTSCEFLLNRAAARRAAKDLDGADADCDAALRLGPDSPEAHVQKGAVYHARRKFRDAIAEYDRTLELDPNFYCAYVLRAGARRHLIDPAGAYADFRKGMDLNPPLAARLIIQSLVETLSAGTAETLRECALHLRRNPGDFLTHLCRGLAYILLGAPADAEPDIRRFHELRPDEAYNSGLLIREAERRRVLSPVPVR
jgi:tetratricopeptide (TPR) repeat protein